MAEIVVSLIVGAALAWFGFVRGKKERALDRRVAWHQEAIEALAAYEEELERLRTEAVAGILRSADRSKGEGGGGQSGAEREIPERFVPSAQAWERFIGAEQRARAALRLADLFVPDQRLQLECSAALRGKINLGSTNIFIHVGDRVELKWAELQARAGAVWALRRRLQESLSVILELEGTLAALLGPEHRRKRLARRLDAIRDDIDREANRLPEA